MVLFSVLILGSWMLLISIREPEERALLLSVETVLLVLEATIEVFIRRSLFPRHLFHQKLIMTVMPRKRQTVEKFIGGWMRVVSDAASQSFARRLRDSDVTVAEFVLLRILLHSDEALFPGELSRSTGLSKGAVSKLLDRAVRDGVVQRT